MEYDNEKELEGLAIQNKHALFGERIVHFDTKQIITSSARTSRTPDGLFLALSDHQNSKLWIVETFIFFHMFVSVLSGLQFFLFLLLLFYFMHSFLQMRQKIIALYILAL
jgi:uncharacterized protein YdaL